MALALLCLSVSISHAQPSTAPNPQAIKPHLTAADIAIAQKYAVGVLLQKAPVKEWAPEVRARKSVVAVDIATKPMVPNPETTMQLCHEVTFSESNEDDLLKHSTWRICEGSKVELLWIDDYFKKDLTDQVLKGIVYGPAHAAVMGATSLIHKAATQK